MRETYRVGSGRGLPAIVIAILIAAAAPLWSQELPKPVGFVNDFANIISASDEQKMEQIIAAVRNQTRAEIAVVTVQNLDPYGSIEEYGIALFDAWKVGSSDDAGVILIVALSERMFRIEVGYGLEGAITDGTAGSIRDKYVLPDLRQNNYGAGLLNGVAAVALEIGNEYGVTISVAGTAPRPTRRSSGSRFGNLFYLIFVILAFGGRMFFWPLMFGHRRRGFYGGGFGAGMGGGSGGGGFGGFGGGGGGGGGASGGF